MFNKAIKTITLLTIGALFLFAMTVSVNAQMMGQSKAEMESEETHADSHESLEAVLADLLGKYEKDAIQELNCDDLGENEFERLGDAVMESQHPGKAHEAMDAMMGGEGSENLRAMHINMGLRYLDCSNNSDYKTGMMSMMGIGGENVKGSSRTNSAVSGYKTYFSGVHTVLAVTTWLSAIAFLLAGTRWFWKKTEK